MYGMFNNCSSLEKLDISNFNFDNVTKIKGMFFGCKNELQTKIKGQYNKIISTLNEELSKIQDDLIQNK